MKKVIKSSSPTDDAKSAVKDARRSFRSAARDARKGARSQYVRARVAAARATAPRRTRTDGKKVAAAGAVGAVGAFFLDPQGGAHRRNVARGKALSLVNKLKGTAQGEKDAPNDQTLAERVKSEIFEPADAPKGSVSVNVERGVVYLRGEVPRDRDIAQLVKQANSVDGVNGVESLLHSG